MSLEDVVVDLAHCNKQIEALQTQAPKKRREHLQQRLKLAKENDHEAKVKAIETMLVTKKKRKQWTWVHSTT